MGTDLTADWPTSLGTVYATRPLALAFHSPAMAPGAIPRPRHWSKDRGWDSTEEEVWSDGIVARWNRGADGQGIPDLLAFACFCNLAS